LAQGVLDRAWLNLPSALAAAGGRNFRHSFDDATV